METEIAINSYHLTLLLDETQDLEQVKKTLNRYSSLSPSMSRNITSLVSPMPICPSRISIFPSLHSFQGKIVVRSVNELDNLSHLRNLREVNIVVDHHLYQRNFHCIVRWISRLPSPRKVSVFIPESSTPLLHLSPTGYCLLQTSNVHESSLRLSLRYLPRLRMKNLMINGLSALLFKSLPQLRVTCLLVEEASDENVSTAINTLSFTSSISTICSFDVSFCAILEKLYRSSSHKIPGFNRILRLHCPAKPEMIPFLHHLFPSLKELIIDLRGITLPEVSRVLARYESSYPKLRLLPLYMDQQYRGDHDR